MKRTFMAKSASRCVLGIFWEGENVMIPKGYDPEMAANDIYREVDKLASLTTFCILVVLNDVLWLVWFVIWQGS